MYSKNSIHYVKRFFFCLQDYANRNKREKIETKEKLALNDEGTQRVSLEQVKKVNWRCLVND